MAVEVYHEPLCRRYYASRCSCAYFFFLLIALVGLILPFFLAYTNVPSFWLKTHTYREQPSITFQHKVLGTLQGTKKIRGIDRQMQIVFSSMTDVENLYGPELRVCNLQNIELDFNRDGITDEFHFTALCPLAKGETILGASVATFFRTKLSSRARVDFDSLAIAEHRDGMGGGSLFVDGDYVLKQKWPFRAKGGYYLPYKRFPLLDPSDHKIKLQETLLPNIIFGYRNRNNTLDYQQTYKVWTPSPGVPDNHGAYANFNLTMVLRVPQQDILYTPTASEVLKDAWLKYLAIFVVVKYLLEFFASFVAYNQLVDTTMRIETPHERDGVKATSL